MHLTRFLPAATALFLAGCAGSDNPFDTTNHDMSPLPGTAERPTVRNRFPESRGGLPLSTADREDRDMTRVEQVTQYQSRH